MIMLAENPDSRSKKDDYPSYYNFKTSKSPKEFFFFFL